ncbi:MAG: response regulator [Prevotellaceae bacterium]|jgi:DNA-binding response OmpR family regulator|nr:response regulator [Prevotellaceae bacterium]
MVLSFPTISILYIIIAVVLFVLIVLYTRHRIAVHDLKMKIRFFIHMAHDIRTPVSLIKAPLSEIETQENLSENGKRLLSLALKNADKLSILVSQLLDIQKVDAHAEKLVMTKQDIYSYMQEKTIVFRVAALHKGLGLQLEISPDFPEIWFDKDKMDRIMDNLLSNAIKYTEKGNVSIIVAYSGSQWTVTIKDSGIGIPAHEQKYLFKQFYRAGNILKSNESGSGLGLLLTKKLVKLLGGHITFSSVENAGTSFTLTFPLEKSGSLPHRKTFDVQTSQEEPQLPSPRKAVLLLVEDHDDMREYLTESLSQAYHVVSAADGTKVVGLTKEINPDIIIADVLLPGLRGDEICRLLKSSIETSHIPFILLSALSDKEHIIMGLEAGANDYIIKPFDFNVLNARIRNILQRREQLREMVFSSEPELEGNNYVNQLDKAFLDKAMQIVERELDNSDFSINEFCRNLAMSRTSVYNKLKALTNQAPNDFIRIIRLNKAKELLLSKKYTIAEVAYMVGFSDPKYFSVSFKKQFGCNPKDVKNIQT